MKVMYTYGKVFYPPTIFTFSFVVVFTFHKGVCAFSREGAGKVAGTAVASSLNVISKRVSIRRATSFGRVSPIDFKGGNGECDERTSDDDDGDRTLGGHGAPL